MTKLSLTGFPKKLNSWFNNIWSLSGHLFSVAENHYMQTQQDLDCLSKDTFSVYEWAIFYVWHEFLQAGKKFIQEAGSAEVVGNFPNNGEDDDEDVLDDVGMGLIQKVTIVMMEIM
ncbi:hypothetical protein BS47DRAFT_1357467 [Hydnum rufescens UP504]|uniref:Uncharacterized protein n=1 Tax=Hydnum rufescens UP504 TaxID=1448309 RepID=A0A9P6E259_9AGAM|nr:hypothetical protein BS47DRAFT_1357467 [Hydnum rufescens UP504]